MKWQEKMAVDPKAAAKEFVDSHGCPPQHWFQTAEEVNEALLRNSRLRCSICGSDEGCLPHKKAEGKPLIMISGFPCAPYSLQRGDRHIQKCPGTVKEEILRTHPPGSSRMLGSADSKNKKKIVVMFSSCVEVVPASSCWGGHCMPEDIGGGQRGCWNL